MTTTPTDPVAAAEEVLFSIGEKKAEAVARQNGLIEEMGDLGFAAHGQGDLAAKKRIAELSQLAIAIDHELVGLNGAQVGASRRLAVARRMAEIDAHRAKANAAMAKIPVLRRAGTAATEGLTQFLENYALLHKVSNEMRRSGVGRAWRDEIFSLACRRSIQFALYTAPGTLNTEPIPVPSSRRELGEVLEKFIGEFEASLQMELDELEPADIEEAAQ
jgi:hypothetical protein